MGLIWALLLLYLALCAGYAPHLVRELVTGKEQPMIVERVWTKHREGGLVIDYYRGWYLLGLVLLSCSYRYRGWSRCGFGLNN